MKNLIFILLICFSINCVAQNKNSKAVLLTFSPGYNSVGIQYDNIIKKKIIVQLTNETNLNEYFRTSACIGYLVPEYFFLNAGVAYSTDSEKQKITPEIGIVHFDKRFVVGISMDMLLGYVRIGIGFTF